MLYRRSGSELLANFTERLTLAWSFQMVAFQISSEKQVCSANTPRSTIRRPSHPVNFAPTVLLSWFHLLSEAGVDVCFRRARAGASTAQILSKIYHFVLASRSPSAGQHSHNGSEMQKQQLNAPKILFSHHCTYRNRGIAWDERAIRRKCARQQ